MEKTMMNKESTCPHRLYYVKCIFHLYYPKCGLFIKCKIGQSNSMYSHSLSSKHGCFFFFSNLGETLSREEPDQAFRIYETTSGKKWQWSSHTHRGDSLEGFGAWHSPEVAGPEQGCSNLWILTQSKPSLAFCLTWGREGMLHNYW